MAVYAFDFCNGLNISRSASLLWRDERGGLADYALITALFGLIVLLSWRFIAHEAGGNLSNTSTNLTNMAVHS